MNSDNLGFPLMGIDDKPPKLPAHTVKGMRELALPGFKQALKKFYKPEAPLDRVFSLCASPRYCTSPDRTAFKALEPYALNPANYWSDVCAGMTEVQASGLWYASKIDRFNLTFRLDPYSPNATPYCHVVNAAEMISQEKAGYNLFQFALAAVLLAGYLVVAAVFLRLTKYEDRNKPM